jgi:dimethylamine/trimethylamine dehydrogenase
MSRDPRYDILFEPVRIGPVTAKNRFYQVPHCTGLGWPRPRMLAALRGMKAEGGWGVVCTEFCSIHPASDNLPIPYASLWGDDDVKAHTLMTEAVHEHGALAGVELWFGGAGAANLYSREIAFDVASMPDIIGDPYQTRAGRVSISSTSMRLMATCCPISCRPKPTAVAMSTVAASRIGCAWSAS